MSEARSHWKSVLRPATASYGSRLERLVSIAVVGTLAGATGSFSMYVLQYQAFAYPWASPAVMGGVAILSGLLVKLLCQQLRASVTAIVVSIGVGLVMAILLQWLPYYLLGVSTLGGWALLPSIRDAITFTIFGQFPLQLTGYLVGVLYDGMTS